MTPEVYLIYAISFSVLAAAVILVLAGKWILLGLKIFWAKLLYKQNAGFVLFINKTGNVGMPRVANFSKDTYTFKKNPYPLPQTIDGSIFGLPYVIIPIDDVTKHAGIYYPVTDDQGKPVYYTDDDGNHILDEDGDKIPKYNKIKRGASFSPDLLRSIIIDQALTTALKQLFDKNKNLFIVGIIAAGASVAAAYFMYDFNQNYLPQMMDLLRTAASCNTIGVTP